MKNTLSLLLFLITLLSFTSCFDIQSETVISEEGKIDMVYDFDMSEMMSMLQMAPVSYTHLTLPTTPYV